MKTQLVTKLTESSEFQSCEGVQSLKLVRFSFNTSRLLLQCLNCPASNPPAPLSPLPARVLGGLQGAAGSPQSRPAGPGPGPAARGRRRAGPLPPGSRGARRAEAAPSELPAPGAL